MGMIPSILIRSIAGDLWELTKPTLAIVGLLLAVRVLILRNTTTHWLGLSAAVLLTIFGLYLFLAGVSASLIPLSETTGRGLVTLRYKAPVILFAFAVGYLATLLEPGLRTVAIQIETVSIGALRRPVVIHTAALGFALGSSVGVLRILSPFSMKGTAIVALLLLLVLVIIAPESIVGIAFDCASAATGPANIPILLGLAIGLSQAIPGADPIRHGFGLIALTAYGTTMAVLILGILGARS